MARTINRLVSDTESRIKVDLIFNLHARETKAMRTILAEVSKRGYWYCNWHLDYKLVKENATGAEMPGIETRARKENLNVEMRVDSADVKVKG
jgi:hypothetical protein